MPGYQGNRGNPPPLPQRKTLQELWPDYLKGGYFDNEKNLKTEFVSRSKVEPLVKEMSFDLHQKSDPQLTNHQLRRFFQHCRSIQARLKGQTSTWAQEKVEFLKLDVVAADAFGKKDKKIPKLFHDFIQKNVSAVRDENDFLKGFLPHFEALVGFGAPYLQEKERT